MHKKYIRKNAQNEWVISNSKTGKSLRNASTQKEAILLAWQFKEAEEVFVKVGKEWKPKRRATIEEALAKKTSTKKTAIKKAPAKKKTTVKKTAVKKVTVKKAAPNKQVAKKVSTKKEVKIRFNNITKKFGTLVANKKINFEVYDNEIHALLGENGAGKSTLMSILFGLYTPTSGTIEISGETVRIKDPRHANELKIAMLPQHFKLVDNMNVIENVILGYENLNKEEGRPFEVLSKLAEQYKLNIDLKAKVGKLSISDKQKVEILKILWRNADIIIFDEPTSILTPQEIEQFLKLVMHMKKIGKTVLIITHKLPEIKAVADRVTVIRKGEYINTFDVSKVSEKQMADAMVGKAVNLNLSTIERKPVIQEAQDILKIQDLNYDGKGYEQSLRNINFKVKRGEIVGIAAIDGNGQSELIKAIAGLIKVDGYIEVYGQDITNNSIKGRYFNYHSFNRMPRQNLESYNEAVEFFEKELKISKELLKKAKASKSKELIAKRQRAVKDLEVQIAHTEVLKNRPHSLVSHIPEDRHKYGLVLDYTVNKNAVLQDIDFYTKFGFINYNDVNKRTEEIIDKYDVRGVENNKVKARALSGGNQQKLILGREIERMPKLLLAAHPTRGLDVGAIRNVYENIISSRNRGMAVLLNSGELDEIMQVSDRIIVLHEGEIVSITNRGELSKMQIGALMAGGKK